MGIGMAKGYIYKIIILNDDISPHETITEYESDGWELILNHSYTKVVKNVNLKMPDRVTSITELIFRIKDKNG